MSTRLAARSPPSPTSRILGIRDTDTAQGTATEEAMAAALRVVTEKGYSESDASGPTTLVRQGIGGRQAAT